MTDQMEQPPAVAAETDPELGKLICTRRNGRYYGLAAALIFIAAMLPVMLILVVVWPDAKPGTGRHHRFASPNSAAPAPVDIGGVLFGTAVILVFTVPLSYAAFRTGQKMFTRCKLWEKGVSAYRFGKQLKSLKYADCEQFSYRMRRSYFKGLYAGTTVTVAFRDAQSKIAFDVPYKEKPIGLSWSILGRTFRCEDELETVRVIASHAIADSWISGEGTSPDFVWCRRATLSRDRITPSRGRYAGRPIRFTELARVEFKARHVCVWAEGIASPIAVLPVDGVNFWPGLEIIRRRCQAAGALRLIHNTSGERNRLA